MKKSFFIGLLLFTVILGFSGCKSTPKTMGKHFITSTAEGLTLDYTVIGEDGKFSEKVIMNEISYGGEKFSIKKNCSLGKSGVIFPEGKYVISGKTVNNLKWENGNAWCVNCYDSNEPEIMIGNDTLAYIYFGWCTCNIGNKTERIFVVDTVTYIGTGAGGIGGESYIGTPKEVRYPFVSGTDEFDSLENISFKNEVRWIATAEGKYDFQMDISEIYDDNGDILTVVVNKIRVGDVLYLVNKECDWAKSNTSFNPIRDEYGNILHNYNWEYGSVWGVDLSDVGYEFMDCNKKATVTYVEFGPCLCTCKDGYHFVMNFKTDSKNENGGYKGWSYFAYLQRIK